VGIRERVAGLAQHLFHTASKSSRMEATSPMTLHSVRAVRCDLRVVDERGADHAPA